VVAVEPIGLQGVRMVFNKPTERESCEEAVRNQDPLGGAAVIARVWMYDLSAAELQHMRHQRCRQALEKIRNRIDAFGVSEPASVSRAHSVLSVQLPGLRKTRNVPSI
jgi:preprotein translocase subunit SecD